ncbi:MAG TPA: YdeI/OmpD-associated family protein [Opitutaceae bacterium]|nr:YdeI/OmpD-associated family protein [Opitutaceae bacterium]
MDAATPPDLAAALQRAGLAGFFAGCTPAHRREYLGWIGEAKKPETRARRIEQAVARIGAKAAEEERRRG